MNGQTSRSPALGQAASGRGGYFKRANARGRLDLLTLALRVKRYGTNTLRLSCFLSIAYFPYPCVPIPICFHRPCYLPRLCKVLSIFDLFFPRACITGSPFRRSFPATHHQLRKPCCRCPSLNGCLCYALETLIRGPVLARHALVLRTTTRHIH